MSICLQGFIFEVVKNLYLIFSLVLTMCACSSAKERYDSYGSEMDSKGTVTVEEFINNVSDVEKTFKIKGRIREVCQAKGCWMTLENDQEVTIRVTFKDYGFFVPKDISGNEVILSGVALNEIIDEDVARHYADDGNVEYKESMRNSVSFVAEGVLIANNKK